jgi:ABC-2 type transport system permease protein
MKLGPLLSKELRWSRHRIVTLLLLLLVLPGFFAGTTVIFQDVIPKDSPVAIAPASENVSATELDFVRGSLTFISDPVVYENRATAIHDLRREQVYAVLAVPPDILAGPGGNESALAENATFTLYVDGSMVPYNEPSKAIRGALRGYLNRNLEPRVSVERRVVGPERSLAEYLLPVFLLGIVLLFAFAYLPYNLASEADVLDRLRVEASLDAVVVSKLLFVGGLLVVPVVAFHAVATYLGYSVDLLAPGAVGTYLLTFWYLGAISTTVMLLTDFSTFGRFLNVALLFAVLTVSSLVYPVGFFSALRREIARQVPLHYSMIVIRSTSLKNLEASLFADWIAGLVGFTVGTGIVLKLAIEWYKRRA